MESGKAGAAASRGSFERSATDGLADLVSELVLSRNQLLQLTRGSGSETFSSPLERLSGVVSTLQGEVMRLRMRRVGDDWGRLSAAVSEISASSGGRIALRLSGEHCSVDGDAAGGLSAATERLVRFCAERATLSAVRTPEIQVTATSETDGVVVSVSCGSLRASAEDGAFVLESSEASAEAGGVLDVSWSRSGRGMAFVIRVPLSMAIVPALIVSVAGERFAIPRGSIVELVGLANSSGDSDRSVESVGGASLLRLRGGLLPLLRLDSLLRLRSGDDLVSDGLVVVTSSGGRRLGLTVDSVSDSEEIVVQRLPRGICAARVYAGNAILGDGSVVMVLDPAGIMASSGGDDSAEDSSEDVVSSGGEPLESFLLFKGLGPEPLAIPLSLVSRLELLNVSSIERSSGRSMIRYGDGLLPLIGADGSRHPSFEDSVDAFALILAADEGPVGIVVRELMDVVEHPAGGGPSWVPASDEERRSSGALGADVVAGRLTTFVDAAWWLEGGGRRAAA